MLLSQSSSKEFLDFIMSHGGCSQIDSVDSILVSVLSPESDISPALSSHDREEISQLYLKFVDLHGTIHQIRKAWDRHRKLFPRIFRPHASYDHSFNGIQIYGKKIEGVKDLPTNLSDYRCGSYGNCLVKNPSAIDKPTILLQGTSECDLQTEGNAGNENKGLEPFDDTEAIPKQSISEGAQIGVLNEIVNESQNVAQIPESFSEFHDTEMQVQSCFKKEIKTNVEPPTVDNLSINSPNHAIQQGGTHDTEALQEVSSREDGRKLKENDYDDAVPAVQSNGKRCLNFESRSEEDSGPPRPSSNNAPMSETNTNLQLEVQAQNKTNQDLSAIAAYTEDQRSLLHGFVHSSQPNQWQAPPLMHGSVNQSYASQIPALSNIQNPQVSHTEYQMVAAQAHTNASLAFVGQHIQQTPFAHTQAQPAQQSSQTHVPQIDEHYGYYQSFQGFPPHIWQYYQQLYYLQQQQHRSSQQDLPENQQERDLGHLQHGISEHVGNPDQQQHATKRKNQIEKQDASTQPQQQSSQTSDQQQYLYFQQLQQFHLQQQQQQQLYLQQQHLFQQQQQQQQQFLLFQQQQLQLQQHYLQQQMLIQPMQEQPSQTEQQKHQSPYEHRDYQPYQQQQLPHNSELEQKNLESNVNAQSERNKLPDAQQSADSCFYKQPVDSPDQ
ncbi:hypothetical protein AXF42_Ash018234 [Apostasia shenzhenica]|uniref:Uncharacterized protein n=1 Tax=Apostasia shenzhenica TaxID=1088818 RepID=A0A2I0B2J0_9ASPA|nr:hypothetical protein AXF42_Ash018234 [Apostasia shenzhenica]